ncbi:MAG: bifunctional precorrin-2 dehydrogenase/sirohydrochlorin ferrochelatase [Syntrophomonadaceae bacterium]|nr:bifunctional precorrin-2 dehydrogenase/sirohydrochlorin ferrochelatase [Syntrophomonadaceae bacterium]
MAHLYPIFLNLAGRNCLVAGGGKVAERKIATLLENNALVKVVSPECTAEIAVWASQGRIAMHSRNFEAQDLEQVSLVFAATGDVHANSHITSLCREKGIWVNAVDDPPNCDFFVPSILRRDSLCIAVSTEGKSPLLAAKLRRDLEEFIPPEYGEWVEILGDLREQIKNSTLDSGERKEIIASLVNSDILDLLREGQREQVKERIKQCMSCLRG